MKSSIYPKVMLLFAALCSTFVASSQNIIYDIGGLTTKNSIIREYHPDEYVIYNTATNSQFIYVNTQTMIGSMIDVTAYVQPVTDMCIKNDYLFFCGRLGNQVLMGYFYIPDLIIGTVSVNTFVIPPHATSSTGTNETIKKLLKIDAYFTSATDFHMFAIGEADGINTLGHPIGPYRCIIDAYYNGIDIYYSAHAEESGVYFFNDLAVTGTRLVVVGDKHDGQGQYMHDYGISAPTSFLYNTIQYYMTGAQLYYPLSEIQIIPLFGSAFATACYAHCDGDTSITVSTYSTMGTLVDRIHMPSTNGELGVVDFAYSSVSNQLGVITRSPGILMHHIDINPATLMMSNVTTMVPAINGLMSCSGMIRNSVFMTSGIQNNNLVAWNSFLTPNLCANSFYIGEIHSNHTESNPDATLSLDNVKYTFTPYLTIASPIVIRINCR